MRPSRLFGNDGKVLFSRVRVPGNFFSRARGLIGRPLLTDDEAWWFARCNAIHMVGMHRCLDVVFVDGDGRITRIVHALKPFAAAISPQARHVIEMRAGRAQQLGLAPGDRLVLET